MIAASLISIRMELTATARRALILQANEIQGSQLDGLNINRVATYSRHSVNRTGG